MPHTLLLADDSLTIQRVIELTFADEDIRVVAVSDGAQAVRQAQSSPPDIVLADIGMPEMDGYEVAAFIKSTPALSHIPVLLLTGAFEPVDEHRARAVRCDGVLVKPFEPQMVISRVKELIAGRSGDATVSRGREAPLPVAGHAPAVTPPPRATDEYFERLDAALASFDSAVAGQPSQGDGATLAPPPARDANLQPAVGDNPPAASSPGGSQTPPPTPLPEPFLSRPEAPVPASADPAPGVTAPRTAPQPTRDAAVPLGDVRGQQGETPRVSADVTAGRVTLAEAFEALLAAEQGRALDSSVAHRLASSETLVDHITRQVIERLADDRMRDVVLEVAERLVKEEIERIKSASK